MPYLWVEPEVALEVGNGRRFYRVYRDGLGSARDYWFTSCLGGTDFDDPGQFDIRDWIDYDSRCSPLASLAMASARGAFEWQCQAAEWLAGRVEGHWHNPWDPPEGFLNGIQERYGPA